MEANTTLGFGSGNSEPWGDSLLRKGRLASRAMQQDEALRRSQVNFGPPRDEGTSEVRPRTVGRATPQRRVMMIKKASECKV